MLFEKWLQDHSIKAQEVGPGEKLGEGDCGWRRKLFGFSRICLKFVVYGLYHGKSPSNHSLREYFLNFFQASNKQIQGFYLGVPCKIILEIQ